MRSRYRPYCFLPSVSGEDAGKRVVIPQNLLKLIHTPEVQTDLGFEPNDPRLMSIIREIDGTWWRSRNLNEEKQHAITQEFGETTTRIPCFGTFSGQNATTSRN